MSEENVKEEVVETVSEETMQEISQEVEKVESEKLEAAKQEGKQEVTSEIEKMKAELAELKAKNEAADKARREEEQRAELQRQIEAERAKAEQPVKKHVVSETQNPTQVAEPVVIDDVATAIPVEQQWREMEKNFGRVSITSDRVIN